MLGFRFRSMYRNIGLSRVEAGKLLHVTERTLRNWETGHHEIPYTAYKLLRILSGAELPAPGWDGWHMHSGKLWSPEGHGFDPQDSNWWSLLCRRAGLFNELYRKNGELRSELLKRPARTGLTCSVTRQRSPENRKSPQVEHADRASLSSHEAASATCDQVRLLVTPHQILTGETKPGFCYKFRLPQACPADARFARSRSFRALPKGGAK